MSDTPPDPKLPADNEEDVQENTATSSSIRTQTINVDTQQQTPETPVEKAEMPVLDAPAPSQETTNPYAHALETDQQLEVENRDTEQESENPNTPQTPTEETKSVEQPPQTTDITETDWSSEENFEKRDSREETGHIALPHITIHVFCERTQTAQVIQKSSIDWRMKRVSLSIFSGGINAALQYYAHTVSPDLIVFESGLRGAQLFAQLEQLAGYCYEGTRVIMIGMINDIKLYRQLMEKGISDYLVPPLQPLQFIRSITDLMTNPDQPFMGRSVAVWGSKGGVGSSILAHNIAWALAQNLEQKTMLIDADPSWGTAGLNFNQDSTKGLQDALTQYEKLDGTLMERLMVQYTDNLAILFSDANLDTPQYYNNDQYETLINAARHICPLTIIDMPHVWNETTYTMLMQADEVILVTSPDLINLRNTKNILDLLLKNRSLDTAPIIILNQMGVPKRKELKERAFSNTLEQDIDLIIPYEPTIFSEASNDGKMLSDIKAGKMIFERLIYLATRLKTGAYPVSAKKKRRLL